MPLRAQTRPPIRPTAPPALPSRLTTRLVRYCPSPYLARIIPIPGWSRSCVAVAGGRVYCVAIQVKRFVMHRLLVLAAAGSVFIGVAVSDAAELLSPPAATTVAATTGPPLSSGDAAAAAAQVPPKGPPVLLEAGKGTLIRLPRPAGTVFIANPEIADVQVKSPSLIYINAKTPGETVLYAVDADDNVLLNA